MRRLREGMDALSRMLEQRERGEDLDPTFEEFMAQYGDMFGPADSLDELLEKLAKRIAAAQAMLDSLCLGAARPAERLAQSLLEDMDLNAAGEPTLSNLRRAFPEIAGSGGYRFQGDQPMCAQRGDRHGPAARRARAAGGAAQLGEPRRHAPRDRHRGR